MNHAEEIARLHKAYDRWEKQQNVKATVFKAKHGSGPIPFVAVESKPGDDLEAMAAHLRNELKVFDDEREIQHSRLAEVNEVIAAIQERQQTARSKLSELESFLNRQADNAQQGADLKDEFSRLQQSGITKQEQQKMAASAIVISKMVDQYLTTTVAKNYVELKKAAGVPNDFRLELEACGEEGTAIYLRPNPTKSKPAARAEFWKSDRGKVIYNLMQHPLVSMGGSRDVVLKRLEDQAPVDLTQFGESILRTV